MTSNEIFTSESDKMRQGLDVPYVVAFAHENWELRRDAK